jgi:2-succinyl-5-enolpyruvyl-6-hydroxy-3-cyclohexene-1-carboxylate synthase
MHDKLGKQIAVDVIRTLKSSQITTITSSTTETTIVTATASTFNDLYGLVLTNTSATVTQVDIRNTTGGTIIATFEVPANDTRGFMLPAGSGFSQTTVNTNWTAKCGTSVASLIVTCLYAQNT